MKAYRRRIALALLTIAAVVAAACLAGCGGGSGGPSAGVTGTVLDDQTLSPVSGATVRVGGATTQTKTDGSFALTGAPVGSPETLVVAASGYPQFQQTISVSTGGTGLGNIYLPRAIPTGTGEVFGTITNNGSGQGGITVFAVSGTTTVTGTSKSGTGAFVLYGVPAGNSVGLHITIPPNSTHGVALFSLTGGQVEGPFTIDISNLPPDPFGG